MALDERGGGRESWPGLSPKNSGNPSPSIAIAPISTKCPCSAASSVHTPFPISITTRHLSSANAAVADQVASGEPGTIGVMLESFLVDGCQDFTDRPGHTAGQSITDARMGWDMTVRVLRELASAVRTRRVVLTDGARLPQWAQSA